MAISEVVHVANSDRGKELFRSGNEVLIAPDTNEVERKTACDLALVKLDGVLVSADARLPNVLVQEAIEAN